MNKKQGQHIALTHIPAEHVDAAIQRIAETFRLHATQQAKQKFAELMKIAQEDNLSPNEMTLYFDAFADLIRTPDDVRDAMVHELQQLFAVEKEPDTPPSVIDVQAVPPKEPPQIAPKIPSVPHNRKVWRPWSS